MRENRSSGSMSRDGKRALRGGAPIFDSTGPTSGREKFAFAAYLRRKLRQAADADCRKATLSEGNVGCRSRRVKARPLDLGVRRPG